MPKIDETRPFLAVNIAILTVSDTRTAADDRSGDTLAEMIGLMNAAGAELLMGGGAGGGGGGRQTAT